MKLENPTDAQLNDACLWFRHDFGLLSEHEKKKVRFEAKEWFSAWQKALADPAVCRGCGRPELHKMCPAWGTPMYMSGQLFTAEMEVQYAEQRKAAMEEARKNGNSGLD